MNQEEKHARAIEFIAVMALQHGQEMNLVAKKKDLDLIAEHDIFINWEYLGDPENPDPEDELIATVLLGKPEESCQG